MAAYNQGRPSEARQYLGRAYELQKGESWETRYALGLVAELLGEKSRAAVDFEAAAAGAGSASTLPGEQLRRLKEYLPLPLPAPAGWVAYTNSRFGFRIFHPVDWEPGPAPQNGDGRFFTSPDGKAEIRASGSFNVLKRKAEAEPGEAPFLYGFRRNDRLSRDGKSRLAEYRAYRLDKQDDYGFEYTVAVTVPLEQWESTQPLIETVMRSFRITIGNAYAGF